MALFGLVRRILAQSQNKRLLRRMMLEGDKYADIRLSSTVAATAAVAATGMSESQRPSPTGSSSSTCRASDASPVAVAASRTSQHRVAVDDDDSADASDADGNDDASAAVASHRSSSSGHILDRASQSRFSVSACVVVPAQRTSEALWIDKLRAQEATYKRSLCRSLSSASVSSSSSTRRRCESEDDAFDMWDYVCPQLVRPRLANEWV